MKVARWEEEVIFCIAYLVLILRVNCNTRVGTHDCESGRLYNSTQRQNFATTWPGDLVQVPSDRHRGVIGHVPRDRPEKYLN